MWVSSVILHNTRHHTHASKERSILFQFINYVLVDLDLQYLRGAFPCIQLSFLHERPCAALIWLNPVFYGAAQHPVFYNRLLTKIFLRLLRHDHFGYKVKEILAFLWERIRETIDAMHQLLYVLFLTVTDGSDGVVMFSLRGCTSHLFRLLC